MRKIENFAQISDLLNAQLKKGVITNNFLRGDDYTREIANGLYIHEADGALLLFRERGDHLVMTFYLHPNAVLSLPETDRPVVTELSCRAKDADAMANAAEQFCALGFREVLRRTRRTRKPEAFPMETTAVPAKPEDFEDISKAKIGDKTMVDALYPALEAGMTAEGDAKAVFAAMGKAAAEGAEKTADMVARFGRAKNVGERSLGTKDPGATSISILLTAMAAEI